VEALLECDRSDLHEGVEHTGSFSCEESFDEGSGRDSEVGCCEVAEGKARGGVEEEQVHFLEEPGELDGETGGEVIGVGTVQFAGGEGLFDEGGF